LNKSKPEFIGIFGGTFDPVHKGHTEIIKNLFELIPLDKVIVIPNGTPPHKQVSVSSEERFGMVTSAFKSVDRVVIDDREIRKKDPSYAVSTLKELIQENPDRSLVWIMGSDAFAQIDSWYQWKDFIKMVNIIVMVRPNHEIPIGSEAYKLLRKNHIIDKDSLSSGREKIYLLRIRPIEIRSTDVRNKINKGKDVSEFLLEEVNELINKRNLYQ
jgi:nicotinate-nucleotide adenylyltransferase